MVIIIFCIYPVICSLQRCSSQSGGTGGADGSLRKGMNSILAILSFKCHMIEINDQQGVGNAKSGAQERHLRYSCRFGITNTNNG